MLIAEMPYLAYIATGKRKITKHYLTANLFFNKKTNIKVIENIRDMAKLYVKSYINYTEFVYTNNAKYKLTIEIKRETTKHDIDNTGYFWAKIFLDCVRPLLIPDDNVSIIPELHIINKRCKKGEDAILFYLTKIDKA